MVNSQKNKVNRYGNIITTVALAVFLILWTIIDRRLQDLESRMRSLELKVTAISAKLGIDTNEQYSSDTAKPLHNQPPTQGQLQ
jgi:hypothetical protein